MKRILRYAFFVVLICVSCKSHQQSELPHDFKNLSNVTVYPADTEPTNNITFEKEIEFGDTKEVKFGRFTDIDIGSDGKVYIADADQSNIKVFKSTGEFLKTVGREGKGPAEFVNIQHIQVNNLGLYVYDNSQKRIVIFSVDSSRVINTLNIANAKKSIAELKSSYFSKFYLRNDSTILASFYKTEYPEGKNKWSKAIRTKRYYVMDDQGEIVSDKLFEMKSAIRVFVPTVQFTVDAETGLYGQGLMASGNDNAIYSSWSDHFLIKVYSPQGKYERAFYYPRERIPLTEKSAKEAGLSDLITNGMSNMDLPQHWPSIDKLLIDDKNRVWISTIIPDQSKREWFILDKKGNLLTKFGWPTGKELQIIKNDYFYTMEVNPETGVRKVVRYTFKLIPKKAH